MPYCQHCGQMVLQDANYCRNCGRDLRSAGEEVNRTDSLRAVNKSEEIMPKPVLIKSKRGVLAAVVACIVVASWAWYFSLPVSSTSAPLSVATKSPALPYPLPIVQNGFARTAIPEVGTIDVPPLMELQSEEMTRKVTEAVKDAGMFNKNKKTEFVLMQKGLQYYSRIMVSTYAAEVGLRLMDPIAEKSELVEFDSQLEEQIRKTGIRVLSSQPLEELTLNGMHCFKKPYRRQSKSDTPVKVNMYIFFNRNQTIYLTMSYRETESNIWEPLFEKSLRSFRIIDIR